MIQTLMYFNFNPFDIPEWDSAALEHVREPATARAELQEYKSVLGIATIEHRGVLYRDMHSIPDQAAVELAELFMSIVISTRLEAAGRLH